jgi:hypothetical protein
MEDQSYISKDVMDRRAESAIETFNNLADFIFTTYEDFGVDKAYWNETNSIVAQLTVQLLNFTKVSSPF